MDGGATVTVSRASRVSDHVHRVKQRDLSWSPPTGASDWSTHKSRDHQTASDWSRRGREQRSADWSMSQTEPCDWSLPGAGGLAESSGHCQSFEVKVVLLSSPCPNPAQPKPSQTQWGGSNKTFEIFSNLMMEISIMFLFLYF